jgi:hypothetical protein
VAINDFAFDTQLRNGNTAVGLSEFSRNTPWRLTGEAKLV